MTVHRSCAALLLASLCTLGSLAASADVLRIAPNPKETPPMTTQSTTASLAALIPFTHQKTSHRAIRVDKETVQLTRYERKDGRNKGIEGEHFSTVMAADGTLKGFANMSLDLAGKPLPSRERTETIARNFLQSHAPDLLPRMEISWTRPHDEPIQAQRDGRIETVMLTGMKLKARNLADGRWFWVIVGSDAKAMVFERDIVWITFPGQRKTEKWLHDSWLKVQTEHAAQDI